ncbi:MAG: hypothetical protein V1747_01260 [Candidatus Omnitrophota bacterium]
MNISNKKGGIMTERNILSLAIKIIGIFVIAQMVSFLPITVLGIQQLWSISSNLMKIMSFFGTILTTGLIIYVAFFSLRKADLIAEKLINQDKEFTVSISSGWEKSAFVLSLRIIGVIWVIKLAPNLVDAIIKAIFLAKDSLFHIQLYLVKSLFGGMFQLLIGLYLISGGMHIVNFAFKHKSLVTKK